MNILIRESTEWLVEVAMLRGNATPKTISIISSPIMQLLINLYLLS